MSTLTIHNNVCELRKIAPFLEEVLQGLPLEGKTRIRLRAGLDEALTNCVCYAYDVPGSGIIEVFGEVTEDMAGGVSGGSVTFVIKDSGKAFNPLEYQAPEDVQRGGLGIEIIKSVFDKQYYERTDGQNILKLIKRI